MPSKTMAGRSSAGPDGKHTPCGSVEESMDGAQADFERKIVSALAIVTD
jgi:hypothetical protein